MNGLRLLIVDDDVAIRERLRMLAESAGADIVGEAGDGQAAIDEAVRLVPAMILLDMSMPGMSGFAAAKIIRQRLPETAIIFISQHSLRVYADEAMRIGARAYILKAAAATELRDALNAVIAGEIFISPSIAA